MRTKIILTALTVFLTSSTLQAAQITNANVRVGANIAVSKLAPVTASKMLESSAGGVITPSSFGPATNLNTVSTGVARDASGNFSAGTISASIVMPVMSRGVVTADASGTLASQALTNGQVLIGSTGAQPVAATLTAGAGISVTNGAGTVTIAASGSPAANLSTKLANYTMVSTDDVLLVNAVAGPVTITLLASATATSGKSLKVKKIDSSANAVTVVRAGADTIDGDTSYIFTIQYQAAEFIADGGTTYHVF